MIDWDRVAALRDEVGPEDFDEVVELFLSEVDEEIETLSDLPAETTLAEKLHFLKGSAMSLGFREFSSLCQTGEAGLAQNPDFPVDVNALASSYAASRESFIMDLPIQFAD